MKHGIEQEIQVVNQEGRLVYKVQEILEKIPSEFLKYKTFGGVYKDVYDSQLEIATDATSEIEELERQLYQLRTLVSEKANQSDLFLIATGANYLLTPNVGELFAEQHHIDAENNEEKLLFNNFFRLFTPELFAYTVNSPIQKGRRSKWKSFRSSIQTFDVSNRVNPNIKPVMFLNMEDIERGYLKQFEYEETFEKKRKKSRYFDISPFTKKDRYSNEWKPTIEIRLFDTQPSIPLTLANAAILEALAMKAKPFKRLPEIEMTYNRNEAILNGMQAHFILDDFKSFPYLHHNNISNCSSCDAVKSLIEWLDPEIKELGFERYLKPVKTMIEEKRDLADWQIDLYTKKRESYIPTLFETTMEKFDKEIIQKRLEIELLKPDQQETKLDPTIKRNITHLMDELQRMHQIDARDLISSLVAIGEVLPEEKSRMEKYVDRALLLVDGSGSVKNNPYLTAYLVELMIAFEKSDHPAYEKTTNWLLQTLKNDPSLQSKVWLSSYVLSILKRVGFEKEDLVEQLQQLIDRTQENMEPWVLAYVIDALTVFGMNTDTPKEQILSELKNNHWTTTAIDELSVTSLIYRLLRNTGYRNEEIVQWLKEKLEKQKSFSQTSIHSLSLVLRSLSEEVVK